MGKGHEPGTGGKASFRAELRLRNSASSEAKADASLSLHLRIIRILYIRYISSYLRYIAVEQ